MTLIRDIAGFPPDDWFNLFIIAMLEIGDQEFPVPFVLRVQNFGLWEFINLELLIFGGDGIIKLLLLEWDVSADKI